MLTLKDFAERIIRPSVLNSIKSGAADNALCDPDVLEILAKDDELANAAIERLKLISDPA